MPLPVVVVGAGLAGLACARRLRDHALDVVVLEAGDSPGGRVRSDRVDGFVVDRGFQVLNTAYPALRSVDLDRLDLRALPRGVRLRRGGRLADLLHPLDSAGAVLRTAPSRAATTREKLALARYGAGVVLGPVGPVKGRPDIDSRAAWAQRLPQGAIDGALQPFMAGVVLEREVTTSRVFTDLMIRMFARGLSTVPAAGMQALPELLASGLPPDTVRYGAKVVQVLPDAVRLADGRVVEARAVVVATDPWTAHVLVPELGSPPAARGVTTYYFAADPWRRQSGLLTADADGSGVLNSVILTASVPEYSADGRSLIATSVLRDDAGPDLTVDAARDVAAELHRAPSGDWELVATRDLPQALPAMPAPHQFRRPVHLVRTGVWVAGDHRDTSSIQGALVSGRRAATSVLRTLATGGTDAAHDDRKAS